MEKQWIISKLGCNTATEWFDSFVVVNKPSGDLRICLHPINLNKYIVRPVSNLNTLDEVSFKLKDMKFFSVFNGTKGFFHLPLNGKSKILTAMHTPIGEYVFNVLVMGLSNANDLFESVLGELLKGLDGVVYIANDILVFGSTQAEHNQNVISFLERSRDRPEIQCKQGQVKLHWGAIFGQRVSTQGIKSDLAKVKRNSSHC